MEVKYLIISYTFISVRLPQLCQGYHYHCVVTANDRGMGNNLVKGLVRGTFVFYIFLFFVVFLCCC